MNLKVNTFCCTIKFGKRATFIYQANKWVLPKYANKMKELRKKWLQVNSATIRNYTQLYATDPL